MVPVPTPVVPGYCPSGYVDTQQGIVDNFSQTQNQMFNNSARRYWVFDDIFLGNKCLKVVRGVEGQALNWTQALDYCRTQPGVLPDLASISNEEEQSKNVNPV